MKLFSTKISKGFKRFLILFLILWVPSGYIGRSMMKYYLTETYLYPLKEYAWTNIDERNYDLLILTGPACLIYNTCYIATHNPKWRLILHFKSKRVLTWDERLKPSVRV